MRDTKENYIHAIEQTYKELKDFQTQTVEYVYKKLYVEHRNKFLVADEVGLGKTIVAKGVIIKAFEKFKPSKENPTFNVIYICSNQALAQENLKKLNFTRKPNVIEDPLNRLIYLAFKGEKRKTILRFDSLTPATSLNISRGSGSQYERAIIFTLLAHYSPFRRRKNGLKWLLKGGVGNNNWNIRTREYYDHRKEYFINQTFSKYKDILCSTKVANRNLPRFYKHLKQRNGISIWDALLGLCRKIDHTNYMNYDFKNEIIVCLRHLLTKVCLEFLNADLIILDEFQRYAEILETASSELSSPAIELAQAVFELRDTKVLMLSATPFKPYTTMAEQEKGDSHYEEFRRVLKFLLRHESQSFWDEFEKDRREFFSKISNPSETIKDLPEARKIKEKLQQKYKLGMVRTERIMVSDDRNILVKSAMNEPLLTKSSDINDFICLDKIVQKMRGVEHLRIATTVEYNKSCPYPLSFLDGYQIKNKLEELKDNAQINQILKDNKSAWINLNRINEYKPLGEMSEVSSIVPNAKMQYLIDDLNKNESWRWLWLPPTISYYQPTKIFPTNSQFSKTLIFSSWKMVPRAVATILSYEAERNIMARYYQDYKEDQNEPYFTDNKDNKKRKPSPLLTFKMKAGTSVSSAMSLFTLLYPSKYLSNLYDPEDNIEEKRNIVEIIRILSTLIEKEFHHLKLNELSSEEGTSERWYWATPLLFDKYLFGKDIESQIINLIDSGDSHNEMDEDENEEEATGRNEKRHLQDLIKFFREPKHIGLGKIPKDLFDTLALICLSSPSICFQRSCTKSMNKKFEEVFKSSYSYALSKNHFFNKPENIALIRILFKDDADSYWKSVLNYCLQGNLQSSLDEFIHLLIDSGYGINEIKLHLVDVLSIRTATIKVDDLNTFSRGISKKIRTHYAVEFGTQDLETDSGTGRVISVRQAFNSPYRPFVLVSTSIGQEGLDFHYYCSKVMHWNLPSNAIDIEQREGRINRYKGLVIRRNVAKRYIHNYQHKNATKSVWSYLFSQALEIEGRLKNKCELVPFWHVEPDPDIKIERIVPLYPFSKDIQKYKCLMDTLTYYRITFGQPRQEELVEALHESGLSEEEIDLIRKNLLIDLSPTK